MVFPATGTTRLGTSTQPTQTPQLFRSRKPVGFPMGSKKDLGCGDEGRNHSKTYVSSEDWESGKGRTTRSLEDRFLENLGSIWDAGLSPLTN